MSTLCVCFADQWCDSTEVEEYLDLANRLLQAVLDMAAAGFWLTDDDIVMREVGTL